MVNIINYFFNVEIGKKNSNGENRKKQELLFPHLPPPTKTTTPINMNSQVGPIPISSSLPATKSPDNLHDPPLQKTKTSLVKSWFKLLCPVATLIATTAVLTTVLRSTMVDVFDYFRDDPAGPLQFTLLYAVWVSLCLSKVRSGVADARESPKKLNPFPSPFPPDPCLISGRFRLWFPPWFPALLHWHDARCRLCTAPRP